RCSRDWRRPRAARRPNPNGARAAAHIRRAGRAIPRPEALIMQTITPFLWFDGNVEDAVRFYASVFPNTRIESANPAQATFELLGQRFMALNGGPAFKFNEAVSFFVSCDTQQEVDNYWRKLLADGGTESQCGWLKDKFG